MELEDRVRQFLEQTLGAMGVPLDVAFVDESDNIRVELTGEGGDHHSLVPSMPASASAARRAVMKTRTLGRTRRVVG